MSGQLMNELMQAPLPQMVERLGIAIAHAQAAMDRSGIAIADMMGNREDHGVDIGGERKSLIELGFTPSFYQVTEATIEARVAFSMAESSEVSLSVGAAAGGGIGFVMFAVSVNASYTNKYSFEATGSSAITAKFTALPPPAILTQILQKRLEKSPTPTPAPQPT